MIDCSSLLKYEKTKKLSVVLTNVILSETSDNLLSDFSFEDSQNLLLNKYKNSKSYLLNLHRTVEEASYTSVLSIDEYFLLSFDIAQLLTKKHDDFLNSSSIYRGLLDDERLKNNLLLRSAIYNGNALNILKRNRVDLTLKVQKESLNLAIAEMDKVRSLINYLKIKRKLKDQEFYYYFKTLLEIKETSKDIQVNNYINDFLYHYYYKDGNYTLSKSCLDAILPLNFFEQKKLFNDYCKIKNVIKFNKLDLDRVIEITQINQLQELLDSFSHMINHENKEVLTKTFDKYKSNKYLTFETIQ